MNFKYFDFPLYLDKSDKIRRFLENSHATFSVFVDVEDFTPDNKVLLFKILEAIQLDIKHEVQIFGLRSDERMHLAQNLDLGQNHRFLGFGMNAERMGLQCKTIPYEIMHVRSLKVLFAHKLSDLQGNVDYKKQLWGLLKQFNHDNQSAKEN